MSAAAIPAFVEEKIKALALAAWDDCWFGTGDSAAKRKEAADDLRRAIAQALQQSPKECS